MQHQMDENERERILTARPGDEEHVDAASERVCNVTDLHVHVHFCLLLSTSSSFSLPPLLG